MKLGYGTYGMKDLDIFELLPKLRKIGYEGIEICSSAAWPTAPEKMNTGLRRDLAKLLADLGFLPPILLGSGWASTDEQGREKTLDALHRDCELANELNSGSAPAILTAILDSGNADWERDKNKIAETLFASAEIAKGCNVMLAIEPHVGGTLDTPEKAAWLVTETNHENLRMNFDVSHFHVQGYDDEKAVALCAPLAVHTHVKDGWIDDQGVHFQLPGEGDTDYPAYMRAMKAAGYDGLICVEVSGMVWGAEGYDPWRAAEFCYAVLNEALEAAGG